MITLKEAAKKIVNGLFNQFNDPDDDLLPMLILQIPEEGRMKNVVVNVPPKFLASASSKNALFNILLPSLITNHKASGAAWICSAWTLAVDKGNMTKAQAEKYMADAYAKYGSLEFHPDRIEQVLITVFDHEGGDSTTAEIKRYEDRPPELAEWSTEAPTDLEGRLPENIHRALVQVNAGEG